MTFYAFSEQNMLDTRKKSLFWPKGHFQELLPNESFLQSYMKEENLVIAVQEVTKYLKIWVFFFRNALLAQFTLFQCKML